MKTELPLGRHLAVLTKMYYGALTRRLEHLEVDGYYSLLLTIHGCGCTPTQQYLADALKIDKSTMVARVDHLVRERYVKKTVNPKDRREHWLELTSKAKKIVPEIQSEISALNRLALKGLPKETVTLFNSSLQVVMANLEVLPANRVIINYRRVKHH